MLLQVWDSRSSPAQTPNVGESKRYTDTVIKVTDDGWRTVTQGSPPNSQLVSIQHRCHASRRNLGFQDVAQPAASALTHEPTAGACLHVSGDELYVPT